MKTILAFCIVLVALLEEGSFSQAKSINQAPAVGLEQRDELESDVVLAAAAKVPKALALGTPASLLHRLQNNKNELLHPRIEMAVKRQRRDEVSDYEGYEK